MSAKEAFNAAFKNEFSGPIVGGPKHHRDFFAMLGAPVPPHEIEWKPGKHYPPRQGQGGHGELKVMAYMTSRFVQDRLDSVAGPANWRNEFVVSPLNGVETRGSKGVEKHYGIMCGISIKIDGEWITKWDAAEASDIEPVKGGHSDGMKRAAVHWGIGRDLYYLPTDLYAPAKPSGNSFAIDKKMFDPIAMLRRKAPEYLDAYQKARAKFAELYKRDEMAAAAPATGGDDEEAAPETVAAPTQPPAAAPAGDSEVVGGGKRQGRTKEGYAQPPAQPAAPVQDKWWENLPKVIGLEGGITFEQTGPIKKGAPKIDTKGLNNLGVIWAGNWTSPTGSMKAVIDAATKLSEYGYFADPQCTAKLRKCFTVTMTPEQLEAAIVNKTTKGRFPGLSYLEMAQGKAQGSAEFVSNDLCRLDTPAGETARYAMKKHLDTPAPAAPKKANLGKKADDGYSKFLADALALAKAQRDDADEELLDGVCMELTTKHLKDLNVEERKEFLTSLKD